MQKSVNNQTVSKQCLKASLFERIDSEHVCPHSRLFFHSRECFVWFFWFISVVVGALAIAVVQYVVMHRQYALYEATHENLLTFMIEAMPYLWFVVFMVMVVVALVNLRYTKYGYRWPVWMILASSVVLSFAGGSALHLFGLGYKVDNALGQYMAVYQSEGKREHQLWQNPLEGRVVGKQVLATLSPTTTIIFEDVVGARWRVYVGDLTAADRELLATAAKMKLLGIPINDELHLFHACAAMPWSIGSEFSRQEMVLHRELVRRQMASYSQQEVERLTLISQQPLPVKSPQLSLCAELSMIKRMPSLVNNY